MASYFVVRDSFGFSSEVAQFISLLTLLSFLMIRNVTYPLSDICFFGASVPCLLVLIRAEADRGISSALVASALIPFLIFLHRVANHWSRSHSSFHLGSDRRGCWGQEDISHIARHRVITCVLLVDRTGGGRQDSPRFPIYAIQFAYFPEEGRTPQCCREHWIPHSGVGRDDRERPSIKTTGCAGLAVTDIGRVLSLCVCRWVLGETQQP